MKMRKKLSRTVCLLVAVIMMVAMSTTTADAASFSKAAPKGLKATCTSGVSVKVTCNKKKGATGYYFYYATKKSGKYKLGVKSTSRTGTIKGLTPGKTYYFKVKAYKGKVLKKFTKMSKPAKCKAVLKAPGVAYKDRCCCRIALKLSGSTGATGYKIYRSLEKNGEYVKVGTTSAKTWIDEGQSGKESLVLTPSTTYYYKVRAYYGSHHSPYSSVLPVTTMDLINGNASKYSPTWSESLVPLPDQHEKLKDRNILFLGSSITYGSATDGVSFADYIEKRDEATVMKLAVSSTNMAWKTKTDGSYVNRLTNYGPNQFIPDIFACQLSLNDSLNGIALGSVPELDFNDLDEEKVQELYEKADTVGGAIGYITAYAQYYWPDCQIVFYTVRNNGYNTQYTKMRTMLYDAQKKYGMNQYDKHMIEIIDMWSVKELTDVKSHLETFCLYMYDNNHPKMAGYLHQWTPEFEKAFIKWMPPAKPADPEEPEQPGQSEQPGEQIDPGDSGGGNDPGDQKDGTSTDGDTNGGSDGGSDGNSESDGNSGSDGSGGSDGDSNGGESESNDDITSIILSWLRAA